MIQKKERNYGIDLLRIVSMIMVVLLHVLGAGGLLDATFGINNKSVWLLEVFAFCAVNCYALISGYVGVNSKFKLSNILILWLQVFIYNFIFYLFFLLLGKITFSFDMLKEMFFPVLSKRYWYFTAYFALFFLMPLLNFIINKFPKKKLKNILMIGFVLFSVLPTVFNNDVFQMHGGYSLYWLIYLYLVGGFIYKYNCFCELSKPKLLFIYFCSGLFSWLSRFGFIYLSRYSGRFYNLKSLFINYLSPTIFIAALCLLVLFSKMNLCNWRRIISFFSPVSFGVYLLHVQPIFFDVVWSGKFMVFSNVNVVLLITIILFSTFFVYLLCSLIDWIRLKIFSLFKVKEKLLFLENKYFTKLF